jgi:iron complex transport system substrate-binding protein
VNDVNKTFLFAAVVLIVIAGAGTYVYLTQPAPTPTATTKTVVDSTGTTVTIPINPQRIVALRSMQAEMVVVLGAGDRLVGIDDMTKKGVGYGLFTSELMPSLMNLPAPVSGKTLNKEELLALDADVVLLGGYGRIAWVKEVRDLNQTAVVAHFEEIGNFTRDLKIIGQVVGAEEKAEKICTNLDEIVAEVKAKVKDVPESEKVRVYFCSNDVYHVYGGLTFEHSQIVTAGGTNVAKEITAWTPEVSPEQLISWNPEVIFTLQGVDVNAILSDPKIQQVDAVKNKRVYAIPESGWDFGSLRSIFAIKWMSSKLYPELWVGHNMTNEAKEFYIATYGVEYDGPSLD